MQPSFGSFLSSWGKEISSRADRVRNLIGSAHWTSDGNHKEVLVRDFLQRYIPPQFLISRGFIRPADASKSCSPEVDILITDNKLHFPLFCEGGLQIVTPKNVAGYIEAKSEFNASSFRDAFAHVLVTQELLQKYLPGNVIWSGIVFSDVAESRTPESIAKTVQAIVSDPAAIYEAIPKAVTLRPAKILPIHFPTCFATYDGFVGFFSKSKVSNEISLRIFEAGDLALAALICDLFSNLMANSSSVVHSDFRDIVATEITVTPYTTQIQI